MWRFGKLPALAVPLLGGCCDCSLWVPALLLPEANATEVPTNALLLSWQDAVSLYDLDREEQIELTSTTAALITGNVTFSTPVASLAPDTAYGVFRGTDIDPDPQWPEVTFTTGAEADLEPPGDVFIDTVDVHPYDRASLNLYGDNLGIFVRLSGPDDASMIEVQLAPADDFADAITTLPVIGGLHDPEVPVVFDIYSIDYLDGTKPNVGESVFLRARALDLAGNAGPWSETSATEVNACATTAGGGAWAAGLALLVGLTRRGRRPAPTGARPG